MLHKLVNVINSTTNHILDGTLFCSGCIIEDKEWIDFLEEKNILENILITKQIGNTVELELSLARLNAIGYYEDCSTFILKNKYSSPKVLYYIYELKCFSSDSVEFIQKYTSIITLISSIRKIAKHNYTDSDTENSIIYSEDKTLFLPIKYEASDINLININDIFKITILSNVFEESSNEKKLLYINELIDYLYSKEENNRFQFLLSEFVDFFDKCDNAYQFYLRDFSYNKLKIELDSKALEYTQKIQTVINDSQTKLIAIPTAFVLVFTVFDFTDIYAIKNIAIIFSLVIFALLIQLFINNQRSTLNFIKENITSYKETFINNNIEKISNKFYLLEKELIKQRKRLLIVEIILWFIPFSLFSLWIYIINIKIISVTIISLLIKILMIILN